MSDGFAGYIHQERDRLNAERDRLYQQRREIDQQLDAIDKEFAAINAYEKAKTGKAAGGSRQDRGRSVRRGSKREAIMDVIRQNPTGLSRGELLEKMGLKGDKSGEMSVSNALTALGKSNQVRRDGGKYHLA
jgi:hypothetical protein